MLNAVQLRMLDRTPAVKLGLSKPWRGYSFNLEELDLYTRIGKNYIERGSERRIEPPRKGEEIRYIISEKVDYAIIFDKCRDGDGHEVVDIRAFDPMNGEILPDIEDLVQESVFSRIEPYGTEIAEEESAA